MSVVLWIIIGIAVLAACCGGKRKNGAQRVIRIDHPHFFDPDEYECSVCGARFRKSSMVCPECGAKFEGTAEDETEFEEEMMEEEEWDEEEGL